jgi:hypothetical protein
MKQQQDENAERRSLAEVAQGAGTHVSTVWRWALRGVRGIKLETVVVGGRRYVTSEAWATFLERLNKRGAAQATINASAQHMTTSEQELDAAGL